MTLSRIAPLDHSVPTFRRSAARCAQPEPHHTGHFARVPSAALARLGGEFSTCLGCGVVALSDRWRIRRKQLARLRQLVGANNVDAVEPVAP